MGDLATAAIAIGVSLTVGVTGLATAWVQTAIGTAAVGAFTEKEELFGKGLILTVIPETILILGFVVGLLMILLLGGH